MYEARKNKEKVSRRIDSADGGAKQRVKLEDGRKDNFMPPYPLADLLIQKKAMKGVINKGIIQTVLVTDVPQTKNFSQITDLAIWWAMAAEYHFQKNLQMTNQNVNSLNPLDYIHSLSDYLPNAPQPQQQINVGQGDRVRMLTHGVNPNQRIGHMIVVGSWQGLDRFLQPANQIIDNINNNINGGQVTPLYCYMGNNPTHQNLIPGIGQGPMLSPIMGSVSLRGESKKDMNAIRNALNSAGDVNTWSNIIDDNGRWKSIENVKEIKRLYKIYKTYANYYGGNHALTIKILKKLLEVVYNVVNMPYNNFTSYLIDKGLATGKGETLWGSGFNYPIIPFNSSLKNRQA